MAKGGARGEETITLPDGREFPVLFTNRAIAEAEQRLGRGVISIMQEFQLGGAGGVSVKDVGILLHAGLVQGRRDAGGSRKQITADQLWDIIDLIGFAEAARIVFEAVANVLAYDPYTDEEDQDESEEDPGE